MFYFGVSSDFWYFSALDAESEAYVQGAIDNLASEKLTLIIIAHRLATIKNANKETLLNTLPISFTAIFGHSGVRYRNPDHTGLSNLLDTLLVKEIFPAFRCRTYRTVFGPFHFDLKARCQTYRTHCL